MFDSVPFDSDISCGLSVRSASFPDVAWKISLDLLRLGHICWSVYFEFFVSHYSLWSPFWAHGPAHRSFWIYVEMLRCLVCFCDLRLEPFVLGSCVNSVVRVCVYDLAFVYGNSDLFPQDRSRWSQAVVFSGLGYLGNS